MDQPKEIKILKNIIYFLCLITLSNCLSADRKAIRSGRYIPELFGAHLGKYIPDDSGKYFHIHIPYDGGYGDTGIKYVHDSRGNLVPLSTKPLGPKDHLRFMLDFNFDSRGWQIINFEWLRDGDENYKFKYFNKNRLFKENVGGKESSVDVGLENEQNHEENGIHVEGEFADRNAYNYSYNNNDDVNYNSKNLQKAIREVIYYIENSILPNL